MIVLDTDVVSEILLVLPNPQVLQWIEKQSPSALHTTAVTEAELRLGAAILPVGKRKTHLTKLIEDTLREDFPERILSFDSAAAVLYADICAHRRALGRPISQFDAQIAAICKARGATLATRNVADFADIGLKLINPLDGARLGTLATR